MTIGRQGRVVESHTLARRAFQLGGGFALVAGIWAVVVLFTDGSWWGPLHAFLAGSVLLAISGASQMFTITWAAAPAPSRAVTGAQRRLVAMGTAAVLAGVSVPLTPLVWLGAAALVSGLGLLGWSIRHAVKRSLLRRFDLSSRFYLLAFACGIVGVSLGSLLGTDTVTDTYPTVRLVHAHLNLVGLVGFTIIGTLPTFLPTIAHHRAVSGREAIGAWWLCVLAGAGMLSGLWLGPAWVGVATLGAAAGAASILTGVLARLWDRGRSRTAFLQVSLGVVWLVVWAIGDGARLIAGSSPEPFGNWTGAAVTAGVGQVLAGSLAYLLPVLAGPPLGPNVDAMTGRAWIPLLTANAAGLSLLFGWGPGAIALAGVWVADFARRLLSLSH